MGTVSGAFSIVLSAMFVAHPTAPDEPLLYSPVAQVETLSAPAMMECQSGGASSDSCDLKCSVFLNFATASCRVKCNSGYYACCSCSDGCKCLMGTSDTLPVPEPLPQPRPQQQ